MYQKYKNVETVKPGGLELKDKLVGVQRVTKVTKGGRAFGFSAIVGGCYCHCQSDRRRKKEPYSYSFKRTYLTP